MPILSAMGTVATIISEEIAPEISPKASTALLIDLSYSCALNAFIYIRHFNVHRPHAHPVLATNWVSRRHRRLWDDHDEVIARSGVRHPQIIQLCQRLSVEPDVLRRHVRCIKHQVWRKDAGALVSDGAQAVLTRHHIKESRLAGVLVAAFLIPISEVRLDLCLRLAACAQLFPVHVNQQKSSAAFGVEARRLNRRFGGL